MVGSVLTLHAGAQVAPREQLAFVKCISEGPDVYKRQPHRKDGKYMASFELREPKKKPRYYKPVSDTHLWDMHVLI